jgi:hypothetical protein
MKLLAKLLALLLTLFLSTGIIFAQQLSRDKLIEDARQMKDLIEACHPDPYINTGGKIEFYSAFYKMLDQIPQEVMSVDNFWWLLSSFLARIQDGHTYLLPVSQPDYSNPGGIPIRFSVLADSTLIIERVSLPEHKQFIGSRVNEISGIEIADLLNRLAMVYPMENIFDRFRNLEVYLWYSSYMSRLFPGWEKGDEIELVVENKAGKINKLIVPTGKDVSYKTSGIAMEGLKLPDTKKCDFVFDWLDKENDIAYLCINKQDEFREYAEEAVAGLSMIKDPATLEAYRSQYTAMAHQWHQRYHGEPGPDSLEMIISRLPSFTEFMKDVTAKLKSNNTDNLIIDLRNNRGGVSLMSDILMYFLYGKEKMADIDRDNYNITFLSESAVRIVPSFNIESLNDERSGEVSILLQTGDYDFYSMNKWQTEKGTRPEAMSASRFKDTKTFYDEYVSGEHSGVCAPKNIYVVGSHNTFSAGYETLVKLLKCGASFAGVPPAQPGNCFGMAITPVQGLKHSGIKLNVSTRRVVEFPSDTEKGWQLDPDMPLDYRTYSEYNFDPNSSIRLIIDRIKNQNN